MMIYWWLFPLPCLENFPFGSFSNFWIVCSQHSLKQPVAEAKCQTREAVRVMEVVLMAKKDQSKAQ